MIFEPYKDEMDVINNIHNHNDFDYVLIRMTETMYQKNNTDANGLLRDLLKKTRIVDYDKILNGGNHGVKYQAMFLVGETVTSINMNFYKVSGKRSDPRFTIYKIKDIFRMKHINIGDLLYISAIKVKNDYQLIIINLTNNIPTNQILTEKFGIGEITKSANRLIPMVRAIAKKGFLPNSKGAGKISPKDVGDTLEFLLGMKANNSQEADFEGNIEIKAKIGRTMDTLFTLRPRFDGTYTESVETNDRSRVSAYTRIYGYDSDKHKDYKSLYVTIGSKISPQNNVGLFLNVNEERRVVELKKNLPKNKSEVTAYWTFEELKKELLRKHPATLWVMAEQRTNNHIVEFKYVSAELSREPQFTTFLSLIESGGITYDWRGYTTPTGKYQGKNHGNAWRIKKKYRKFLFGRIERINLLEEETIVS